MREAVSRVDHETERSAQQEKPKASVRHDYAKFTYAIMNFAPASRSWWWLEAENQGHATG